MWLVSGGSLDLHLESELLTLIMVILLCIVASLGLLRENVFCRYRWIVRPQIPDSSPLDLAYTSHGSPGCKLRGRRDQF